MDDVLDTFGLVAIVIVLATLAMFGLANGLTGDYNIQIEYMYANDNNAYIVYRDTETDEIDRAKVDADRYLCLRVGDVVDATIDGLSNVESIECPDRDGQ
jgi:hypothetical protein